jgi:hypothetical protein
MVMGCSSLVEHESDSTQTRPWGSANFPQTPEKFSGMEIGRKGEDTGKESKNNSAPPPQQRKHSKRKRQASKSKNGKQSNDDVHIQYCKLKHFTITVQKHSFTLASLLDYQSRVT